MVGKAEGRGCADVRPIAKNTVTCDTEVVRGSIPSEFDLIIEDANCQHGGGWCRRYRIVTRARIAPAHLTIFDSRIAGGEVIVSSAVVVPGASGIVEDCLQSVSTPKLRDFFFQPG